MKTFEQPLARVLKDFCHVEWYEAQELADIVGGGNAKFDIAALREQFEAALNDPKGLTVPVNQLTANEFETDAEARDWMAGIYRLVFPGAR